MMYIDKYHIVKKLTSLNKGIIFVSLIIFFFGLFMLYSASAGSFKPYFIKQFLYFCCFFPITIFISLVDIKFWFKISYFIYFLGLFLLILVELVGYKSMGATRWINLGIIRIQPSEIMKISLILGLARYFFQTNINDIKKVKKLILPITMYAIPCVLILKQPNLGTALILSSIFFSSLFFIGVQIWKFVVLFLFLLFSVPLIWSYGLHNYQKQRVLTFLNPESDPLNSGYNIIQSKIAIGSGGLWGNGYLKGSQAQLEFLPEKHTDFIFTVIAEEFGFIGSIFVILLFILLFIFLLYVVTKCNHSYGKIIVAGIYINLFCHFFINIGMVTGILPVVGTPFPLLSYGGSITVSTLISIGFVLNVDINRNEEFRIL